MNFPQINISEFLPVTNLGISSQAFRTNPAHFFNKLY